MYYSLIGFLAIILHLLINSDVIFLKNGVNSPVRRNYKQYLGTVLAFYIVDMFWGILSQTSLTTILYIDTMAYYVTVAFSLVFWCRYVISYLNLGKTYAKILILFGVAFTVSTIVVLAINYYAPIIFDYDANGQFRSKIFRIVAMVAQVIIFSFAAFETFRAGRKVKGRERMRCAAIGIYGSELVITVILQYFFPFQPVYAIGLMLGTCMLHVFVQEDEKAEIKKIEIRNQNVIQALASSYEQLNYISMKSGKYIATCTSFDISEEYQQLKDIQTQGIIQHAISFACRNLVSPAYRVEMSKFADLTTIDSRMAYTHMLSHQFKNYNDVWYEWNYIVADRNEDGTINHLIWAIRKIEDEKQAEIRRQKLLEDNIAANKAKTVFLQNMSHEIRTPLNAMFGFAQLLGMPEGSWSEEERDEYNKHILNSYYMMDMLIGDIIDVADSEHGNYRIETSDVLINDACRSAMSTAEYRKPANVAMRFVTDLDDNHIVKTDGRRVQQVLVNYLINSCKHTIEGEIVLSCSASDIPGKIVFAVTDTGEGVPKDKADEIFKRFIKLDQFTQGSGLGLNICQMVAKKLNGEVYLDKTYENGARFVFVIDDIR